MVSASSELLTLALPLAEQLGNAFDARLLQRAACYPAGQAKADLDRLFASIDEEYAANFARRCRD